MRESLVTGAKFQQKIAGGHRQHKRRKTSLQNSLSTIDLHELALTLAFANFDRNSK
jgi:hypothetical protein